MVIESWCLTSAAWPSAGLAKLPEIRAFGAGAADEDSSADADLSGMPMAAILSHYSPSCSELLLNLIWSQYVPSPLATVAMPRIHPMLRSGAFVMPRVMQGSSEFGSRALGCPLQSV